MIDYILPMILGVLVAVIGVLNIMGNIKLIKMRHRHRVRPEDVRAFGRLMGIGTLLNGAGLVLFGIFGLIGFICGAAALDIAGKALLIAGIAAGLPMMIFAMIKYNKGIF